MIANTSGDSNNWHNGSALAFAAEFGESQNRESRVQGRDWFACAGRWRLGSVGGFSHENARKRSLTKLRPSISGFPVKGHRATRMVRPSASSTVYCVVSTKAAGMICSRRGEGALSWHPSGHAPSDTLRDALCKDAESIACFLLYFRECEKCSCVH